MCFSRRQTAPAELSVSTVLHKAGPSNDSEKVSYDFFTWRSKAISGTRGEELITIAVFLYIWFTQFSLKASLRKEQRETLVFSCLREREMLYGHLSIVIPEE